MAEPPRRDDDSAAPPDPSKVTADPDALRESHRRYGEHLRKAGLPFDDDEFDEPVPGQQQDGETGEVPDGEAPPSSQDAG